MTGSDATATSGRPEMSCHGRARTVAATASRPGDHRGHARPHVAGRGLGTALQSSKCSPQWTRPESSAEVLAPSDWLGLHRVALVQRLHHHAPLGDRHDRDGLVHDRQAFRVPQCVGAAHRARVAGECRHARQHGGSSRRAAPVPPCRARSRCGRGPAPAGSQRHQDWAWTAGRPVAGGLEVTPAADPLAA